MPSFLGKHSEAAWSKSGASRPTSVSPMRGAGHGTPSSCSRPSFCALSINPSDDPVAYQMRDRPSFVRFLGPALEDKAPDAKTVWLCREQLSQAGLIETLFEAFDA